MPRPYQVIDAPATTPLPYGLLSVVQPLDTSSDHWQNGIVWQSRCPSPGGTLTYDECIAITGVGAPPAQPTKVENVTKSMRAATSFTPYLEIDCSPVGSGDLAGYVRQTFTAIEPFAVERALWTGVAGNGAQVVYPRLAAASSVVDADGNILQTVPVTGGPLKPADALGFIESQMASCLGAVGVIHVPRRAFAALSGQLLIATGGQMKTKSGNLVAVGGGYTGSSPGGAAPSASQSWIYGTGQIFGKWGDIRVLDMPGAFNRAKNIQKMIAERTYLLGWDCCHVGVLVDLSGS